MGVYPGIMWFLHIIPMSIRYQQYLKQKLMFFLYSNECYEIRETSTNGKCNVAKSRVGRLKLLWNLS